MMITALLRLVWLFLGLSLLAVGSGNSVIPAIQHAAVDSYHWTDARHFLELFAISRAAPGPGSLLVVVLVGQQAAGLPGAAAAALSMFGPSCLLVHLVSTIWARYRDSAWRDLAERALAPVAIGLIFASALALARGTEHAAAAYAITAVSAVVLAVTEMSPLWPMAVAAGFGWWLHL